MLRFLGRTGNLIRNSYCFSQDVKTMKIGVPREVYPEEKRVALTPEGVERLVKAGFTVLVEDGAGVQSSVPNDKYLAAGAKIAPIEEVYHSDILLKVRQLQYNEKLGKN